MSTIADFRTWFNNRVRDAASRFTDAQRDDAITAAVKRYSLARPLQGVQDYAGDGALFDLALPTGWVTDFSIVREIEYPAGERTPVLLEHESYQLYQSPSAIKIRLLSTTPAAGKTARVFFTKPHLVDAGSSTIPAVDEEAVSNLAAAIGLRELASIYAGTVDPSIAADVVNYRSKSQEYTSLADKLEAAYRTHLGLDKDSEAKAASGFTDVDQTDSVGLDRLTHPNRYR
jgi:hypothetical protein